MYEQLPDGSYLVHSRDKICKIEGPVIISDDIEYWKHYFDLDTDYRQIDRYLEAHCLKHNDIKSLKCLQASDGLRLCNQPYLETCLEFLLSAQSTVGKIHTCIMKILDLSTTVLYDKSVGMEYKAFPTIDQLKQCDKETFIQLGAGFRAENIMNFINNYQETPGTSYNGDMEFLQSYKGIGPKIANCIALYALRYMDAFPVDVRIQRYLDSYSKDNPFVIPDKYAGILQIYIYQNMQKS